MNIVLTHAGEPQYVRSIQGHSGLPEGNPILFTLLWILYEWTTFIFLSGSPDIFSSVVQGGLTAGGASDRI